MKRTDCISREEAIKAIEEKAKTLKNEDTINGLCGAVAILYDLPSVQPKLPEREDHVSREVDIGTNGDMIRFLFPNFRMTDHFELIKTCEIDYFRNGNELCEIRCSKDWWNAPYKGGAE